ncbi:MAG: hypothetical protein ACW97V_17230 [Promethearchaeota archaeon]|jgi:hypothetical protein
MILNSRSIEKQVEDFLENSFTEEDYIFDNKVQRKRFKLLSTLVADLFNCKNSTLCFQNVSNLIILILNIYCEKFPVDLYSSDTKSSKKKPPSTLKQILKEHLF